MIHYPCWNLTRLKLGITAIYSFFIFCIYLSNSSEFLGLMKKVSKSPMVMDVLNIPGVQRSLERLADLLGKIQKALGEYLERERSSFPRYVTPFFFRMSIHQISSPTLSGAKGQVRLLLSDTYLLSFICLCARVTVYSFEPPTALPGSI